MGTRSFAVPLAVLTPLLAGCGGGLADSGQPGAAPAAGSTAARAVYDQINALPKDQ